MKLLRPLLPLLFVATALAQEAVSFTVGTWNIEFLGAEAHLRRDTAPRSDDDLAAIGKRIVELGVCVLAVQEICGAEVLERVAAAAGPSWAAMLGTTGSWDDGKTQQGIGFLWNRDAVELLSAEELLELPSEREGLPIFHRKPMTACFRHQESGCDFRLVTVHLKAGQKSADEHKRRLEATLLREWLDWLAARDGEDRDVLVLGDCNSGFGAQPEQIFESGGVFAYLEPPQPAASILHFDAQVDQVIAAADFAELRRDSLRVHGVDGDAARRAFRKTYSDHFPVTVTVAAAGDDDPDATFATGRAGATGADVRFVRQELEGAKPLEV
jgi:endonuclease/exonuclease/phosphatase family metal-dependent hydrolase